MMYAMMIRVILLRKYLHFFCHTEEMVYHVSVMPSQPPIWCFM